MLCSGDKGEYLCSQGILSVKEETERKESEVTQSCVTLCKPGGP